MPNRLQESKTIKSHNQMHNLTQAKTMSIPTRLDIGIDDTDSLKGGCTTHVAYEIVKRIRQTFDITPIEYPYLVRLNPNFPRKTKGNAAIKISYPIGDNLDMNRFTDFIEDTVKRNSHMQERDTNPAVALSYTGIQNGALARFYGRALCDIISVQEALDFAQSHGISILFLKDSKIGSVGAISALGADLSGDCTYELLAYRSSEMCGKPRKVDKQSIILMDQRTRSLTFNNIDLDNRRILITPHGPDPILFGIRGETPEAVLNALSYLKINEEIAGWMIFKTNQGTDAHFQAFYRIGNQPPVPKRPHIVFCANANVCAKPRIIRGGHVVCRVDLGTSKLDVVCYRESGRLRHVVSALTVGDKVLVCGGTRQRNCSIFLNLEKLEVLELVNVNVKKAPICPNCRIRCDSKGLRQGYRCRHCDYRMAVPVIERTNRRILEGTYLPDPTGQRHLTKPFSRYGVEATRPPVVGLIQDWFR